MIAKMLFLIKKENKYDLIKKKNKKTKKKTTKKFRRWVTVTTCAWRGALPLKG